VREVDDHAGALALANRIAAESRQALIRIAAAALRGAADLIRREVHQAEVPDTAARERLDRGEVALECLPAFDPAERGDLVGRLRRANFLTGARPHQLVGMFLHRAIERIELLRHALRAALLRIRRGPEAEELPGDAALA
jgi:hypothetical protein